MRVFQTCAGGVCLLGAIVMAGWWLRIAVLVQVIPGFVPMQFNTALCFVCCGAGTLCLTANRKQAAGLMGGVVLMIAGLTTVEYLTTLQFPLDEIFVRHWLADRTTHPGRMASSSAISFLLYSLVLLSGMYGRGSVQLALIASLLCAQVMLLGVTSLAGYLLGSEHAYTWVQLTRMAVHTTIGFLLLGVAGLGILLEHIRSHQPGAIWRKPILIGQSLCLIGVLFWHSGKNQEAKDRLANMRTTLTAMRHEIELKMNVRNDALHRLILRGQVFSNQPELWEEVAGDMLEDFPALDGVFLLTSRGESLSVVADEDLQLERVLPEWMLNDDLADSSQMLSDRFQVVEVLTGTRYVLGRRMPPGGPGANRLVVAMDVEKVFDDISEFDLRRYGLLVMEGDQQLYPSTVTRDTSDHSFQKIKESMPFFGRNLTIHLHPLSSRSAIASIGGQEIELMLSFALASLAMLLAYQMRIHRERAKAAEAVNLRLEDEAKARKEADNQLREFNRRLKESNEDLESFAYVASHDLQEPLRKIRTFGDRLVEQCGDQLDDKGKDYLSRLTRASERMSRLIEDLLTYSQVNTRARPMESLELNNVMAEVLDSLQLAIEESGAEITVQHLPEIQADSTQMHQLFQNLVGNALKFSDHQEKPFIQIESEATDLSGTPAIHIRVKDNGIGIDPDHVEKIFAPFHRLHGRAKYPGSGIGLSVCKKIMDRHGGKLQVEYAAKEGSVFLITLPLSQTNKPSGTS